MNKNNYRPLQSCFQHNNCVIEDKKNIVEYFNDFFVNVGPNISTKIPKTERSPQFYLKGNYVESFYAAPATREELFILFNNIKATACGWDKLDAKVVKNCFFF